MNAPIHVLLQTTIEPTDNDWHIGRFSKLRDYLASLTAKDGSPLFEVTARDRDPVGAPDAVLSTLDSSYSTSCGCSRWMRGRDSMMPIVREY